MNSHPSQASGAPLAGVRVLDLTRLLPGPLATQHLADLGADVIKIEDTDHGDYAASAVRRIVNRNKRGIRIDLKNAAGAATLLRLCRDADVLVEGFRPGVMDKLGAGYQAVAAINPKIVYCSISGFGQTGPLRDMPGHDVNYAALTGVAAQVGNHAGLALSNLPLADLLGGTMTSVMGLLAALFDAARTGRGRHVDIAIADGVLAHAVLPLASLHQEGRTPRSGESTLTGALACYGFYRTSDGGQLAVGPLEKKFWDALCKRLERSDLALLHRTGDPATEQRVRAELAALFGSRPLAHWTDLFADGEACVTPVLDLDAALEHPHFRARAMSVPSPRGPQLGCPVKMTDFEAGTPRPAPQPGEHTQQVLLEAGFEAEEVARLRAAAAIA